MKVKIVISMSWPAPEGWTTSTYLATDQTTAVHGVNYNYQALKCSKIGSFFTVVLNT